MDSHLKCNMWEYLGGGLIVQALTWGIVVSLEQGWSSSTGQSFWKGWDDDRLVQGEGLSIARGWLVAIGDSAERMEGVGGNGLDIDGRHPLPPLRPRHAP